MMYPRKLLSLVCALLMMVCPALAQNVLVEGEITLESDVLAQLFALDAEKIAPYSGEVTAHLSDAGFSAQWDSGLTITGTQQADGSLSLTGEDLALLLPALPAGNLLDNVHAWLDQIGGERPTPTPCIPRCLPARCQWI